MVRARAVGALLLPFGVVAGQYAGCVALHGHGHDHLGAMGEQHGMLPLLHQGALPLLALSVGLAMLAGARGRRWALSGRALAATLGGAFLAVELVEHAGDLTDAVALLGDRGLWTGVAVQVVLALVLAPLLRAAHEVGTRLRAGTADLPSAAATRPWRPHDDRPVALLAVGPVPGRGPPA